MLCSSGPKDYEAHNWHCIPQVRKTAKRTVQLLPSMWSRGNLVARFWQVQVPRPWADGKQLIQKVNVGVGNRKETAQRYPTNYQNRNTCQSRLAVWRLQQQLSNSKSPDHKSSTKSLIMRSILLVYKTGQKTIIIWTYWLTWDGTHSYTKTVNPALRVTRMRWSQ